MSVPCSRRLLAEFLQSLQSVVPPQMTYLGAARSTGSTSARSHAPSLPASLIFSMIRQSSPSAEVKCHKNSRFCYSYLFSANIRCGN
ncbi:hypothetical protein U9M48_033918 [Paspalum notatum var. saurae]|uniref:Uncharacterized protein n=1 Tax=Paspalum notatum var. saurae TaxID=547442 RepID=A0AAQ3U9N9_PASNO